MTALPGTPLTPIDFQMDTPSRAMYEQDHEKAALWKRIAGTALPGTPVNPLTPIDCQMVTPSRVQYEEDLQQAGLLIMESPFDKQEWLDCGTFLQRHPASTPLVPSLCTLFRTLNQHDYPCYFDEAAKEFQDCFSHVSSVLGKYVQKLERGIQKPLSVSEDNIKKEEEREEEEENDEDEDEEDKEDEDEGEEEDEEDKEDEDDEDDEEEDDEEEKERSMAARYGGPR